MEKPNQSSAERMEIFNKSVGHWLREARIKAGLSLLEAAARIEFTAAQMQSLEDGKLSPDGRDFYTLIAAYKLPLAEVNAFLRDFGLQVTEQERTAPH